MNPLHVDILDTPFVVGVGAPFSYHCRLCFRVTYPLLSIFARDVYCCCSSDSMHIFAIMSTPSPMSFVIGQFRGCHSLGL